MQAAVGVAQLAKLDGFIDARKRNFQALREGLRDLEEFFVLPEATLGADPSWFGFPIAVRPQAPFSRTDATRYLEERKIATRLLFGGNLVRQPAYKDSPRRIIGSLENTDFVMNRVFWIGVFPGITAPMVEYIVAAFHALCGRKAAGAL
jgi:CDP-6-deoxy-D-xylo-4-hexulose-3-dehydrase